MAAVPGVEVVPVEEVDFVAVGDVLVDAYGSVWSEVTVAGYEPELRAVHARVAAGATVLMAWDRGYPVGTVTYDPPAATTTYTQDGSAGIRMLGVRPSHHRRGIGRLLVEACICLARGDGCPRLELESDDDLTGAHRLYELLGFVRLPARDRLLEPGVTAYGFQLEL